MGDCKPLGFLIGLPFALVALFPSFFGAVFWVILNVTEFLNPCCGLFSKLAKLAGSLVKLPVEVMAWFMGKIPC